MQYVIQQSSSRYKVHRHHFFYRCFSSYEQKVLENESLRGTDLPLSITIKTLSLLIHSFGFRSSSQPYLSQSNGTSLTFSFFCSFCCCCCWGGGGGGGCSENLLHAAVVVTVMIRISTLGSY